MSNRLYQQFQLSLVKERVSLFAKATIGASGAPTLNRKASEGFLSLTRTGAGTYALTLENRYNSFLKFNVSFLLASGLPAGIAHCVKSETVSSTKVITFTILDAAGAAVDPDSGSTMYIELEVKRSSVAL